jgi:hypothetical protein|tara:strand:+ start:460 stop:1353 length:894 start_codon:yes stop_codon:yes gene_type:complete
VVADFEMKMTTSKPSFQRIAIAKSLQELASKAYMRSTKNRDMVPFIKKIQERWRAFTVTLKDGGYEPFDTKKFGYARNCVPVLVSTGCNEGKLIPCDVALCPFCWSRRVVIRACKLLEGHKNDIENWKWGYVDFGGAFDAVSVSVKAAHQAIPDYSGVISYTYLWGNSDSEIPSFSGRVKYLAVGEANHPISRGVHEVLSPFTKAKDAPRAIGQAFAYPVHIMPPVASKEQVDASVYWWNALREMKLRAFRTKGIFYSNGKLRTKKVKEDKFDEVYKRLEALERKLGVSPDGRNDNE